MGAASLFSDAEHEMATSVLPTFLTFTLHAGPAALGVIEGVSDALTGLSKLAGGPLDNDPTRRSRLASGGYLGTDIATSAIGLTTGGLAGRHPARHRLDIARDPYTAAPAAKTPRELKRSARCPPPSDAKVAAPLCTAYSRMAMLV